MLAMFKCHTTQAMPVTSILPMDVPQNPLTSGKVWNKRNSHIYQNIFFIFFFFCSGLISF